MMCMTSNDLQTSFGDGLECLKAEIGALLAKYEHYSSGVVRLEVNLYACCRPRILITLVSSMS